MTVSKSLRRRVKTPAGARFFKKPIGALITPGDILAARKRHGAEQTNHHLAAQNAASSKMYQVSQVAHRNPARNQRTSPRPPKHVATGKAPVPETLQAEDSNFAGLADDIQYAHDQMLMELHKKHETGGERGQRTDNVFSDHLADAWMDSEASWDAIKDAAFMKTEQGKALASWYADWEKWMGDAMNWMEPEHHEEAKRLDAQEAKGYSRPYTPPHDWRVEMSDEDRKRHAYLDQEINEIADKAGDGDMPEDEAQDRIQPLLAEQKEIEAKYIRKAELLAKAHRRVRTPAGAKFFKKPIGALITPQDVADARGAHGDKRVETMLASQQRNAMRDNRRKFFANQADVRAGKRAERVERNAAKRGLGSLPSKPAATSATPAAALATPAPAPVRMPGRGRVLSDTQAQAILSLVYKDGKWTDKDQEIAVRVMSKWKTSPDEQEREMLMALKARMQQEGK